VYSGVSYHLGAGTPTLVEPLPPRALVLRIGEYGISTITCSDGKVES
jgi:hypothetical protein